MLLRAYAVNLAVTAAVYGAVWAWAPTWPQVFGSFEQGIALYAQDHTLLAPIFYGVIAPH